MQVDFCCQTYSARVPHPAVFTEMDIPAATVFSALLLFFSGFLFFFFFIRNEGTLDEPSLNSPLLMNLIECVNDYLKQEHIVLIEECEYQMF